MRAKKDLVDKYLSRWTSIDIAISILLWSNQLEWTAVDRFDLRSYRARDPHQKGRVVRLLGNLPQKPIDNYLELLGTEVDGDSEKT